MGRAHSLRPLQLRRHGRLAILGEQDCIGGLLDGGGGRRCCRRDALRQSGTQHSLAFGRDASTALAAGNFATEQSS
jgi:hypothetical protein